MALDFEGARRRLQNRKERLEAELGEINSALEKLDDQETLEAFQTFWNVVESAGSSSSGRRSSSAGMVDCPVCGEAFKASGLNRHITIAARDDKAHADYKAQQGN